MSTLADITFSLEDGLIADGRLQLIAQIFTKSLSENHSGIQAISLSAIERLNIQNSIQINSIWNCLKHGNDLVKMLASRVLAKVDCGNLYNNLSILLEYIDSSVSPKISGNLLTIMIEIIKDKKVKELPSIEIPKIIGKLIRMLDSISPSVRGRVYIVLALIAENAKPRSTTVADICSAKVVATVEREMRRNVVSNLKSSGVSSGRSSRTENNEDNKGLFLTQCLSYRK